MIGKALILTATPALAAVSVNAATPASKLGVAKARVIALKAAPGKVQKAEYEKEGGGWRYSLHIRQSNRIHEIHRPSVRDQRHARLPPRAAHPRPAVQTALRVRSRRHQASHDCWWVGRRATR